MILMILATTSREYGEEAWPAVLDIFQHGRSIIAVRNTTVALHHIEGTTVATAALPDVFTVAVFVASNLLTKEFCTQRFGKFENIELADR